MELLKPLFKLPEVAYGAGVSASNLTNWYDRGLADRYCTEKDGWKRYAPMDVYHIALIKQLVVLGVPITNANDISKHYLNNRMIPCRVAPVSSILFVVMQVHQMLFVEPADDAFLSLAYDKIDGIPGRPGEFPQSRRAHIVLPVGPVLEVALSRALTGRDDVELEYNPSEVEKFAKDVAERKAVRDQRIKNSSPANQRRVAAGEAYTERSQILQTSITLAMQKVNNNEAGAEEELRELLLEMQEEAAKIKEEFSDDEE